MSWPLDLGPWVTRIKAQAVAGVRHVGLAGDLQRVQDIATALPGVWIMPSEDTVTSRSVDGTPAGRRRVTSRVMLLIALRDYGESSGGRAADALQAIRQGVSTALRGWQPDDRSTAVHFAGGRALQLDDATMWWGDFYEVTVYE